jgi:hypothetical protein
MRKGFEIEGRNGVLAFRRDREDGRQFPGVKPREDARRFAVTLRDGAVLVDHALVAEILDEEETGLQILAVDLRRRQPKRPQAPIDRHEGVHGLGELRERRIGLAAPHGRADEPRRRDHQDRGLAGGFREALVSPHRRIAEDRHALGLGPSARIEQRVQGLEPLQTRHEGSRCGERCNSGRRVRLAAPGPSRCRGAWPSGLRPRARAIPRGRRPGRRSRPSRVRRVLPRQKAGRNPHAPPARAGSRRPA